jgi:DNA-binding transcriptional MocR family regulator
MERVPFCEEAQHMAKRPPSLRMPSIALERFSGPLHRRLCLALSQQILSAELRKGDRLPSTRAFAKALGISRNTVVSAYDKLAEHGYTISKVGSGTHVALTLTHISRPASKPAEGTKAFSASPEFFKGLIILSGARLFRTAMGTFSISTRQFDPSHPRGDCRMVGKSETVQKRSSGRSRAMSSKRTYDSG